jgi:hypothetical protein
MTKHVNNHISRPDITSTAITPALEWSGVLSRKEVAE